MSDRTRAEIVAGSVLLFHVSPTGGSHGPGIDGPRAERVAEMLTGPQLLALLIEAAERGARDGESELSFGRYRIIDEVRRLAESTDSLRLHLFIEKEDARLAAMGDYAEMRAAVEAFQVAATRAANLSADAEDADDMLNAEGIHEDACRTFAPLAAWFLAERLGVSA